MPSRTWSDLPTLPPTAGEWLKADLGPFGTVGGLVTTAFAAYAVVPHRADHPTNNSGEVLHPELAASLRSCLSPDPDGYVAGLWDGYGFFAGGTVIQLDTGEQCAVVPPLGREVMAAPRLELPGRGHTLFVAELEDLDDLDVGNGSLWSQSPNLFWPRSRAWLIGGDTDIAATFVAGTATLVGRVLATVPGAAPVGSAEALSPWAERPG